MFRPLSRTPRAAVALTLGSALALACAKNNPAPTDSAHAADSARAASSAAAVAPTPIPAPVPMTEANVFAVLDEANLADSATGALAASKGTAAGVRAYGRDMMKDHHAMRRAGEDLAKQLAVAPVAAPTDASAAADRAVADSLAASPAGAAWDSTYLAHAVAHHTAVLVTAQSAMASVQHPELKAMIEKAAPIVQQHLDRARSLASARP